MGTSVWLHRAARLCALAWLAACAPLGYGSEARPGALDDAATRREATADVDGPDTQDVVDAQDVQDVAVDASDDALPDALPDVLGDVASDAPDDADDGAATTSAQRSCMTATLGCGLVEVPRATYTMGDVEVMVSSPVQPMQTVSAFAIDRHEVSVARFRRYWDARMPAIVGGVVRYPGMASITVSGTPSEPTRGAASAPCNWSPTPGARERHPINCIDWVTAMSFCVWDGGRLPTEAEWELAARGTDGRPWPWGRADDATRACSSVAGAREGTCVVDDPAFAMGASPFGAVQMVGNVWEWCADWYAPYTTAGTGCWGGAARTDPLCSPGTSMARMLRGGGAWSQSDARLFRAASRSAGTEAMRDPGRGVRCVRSR